MVIPPFKISNRFSPFIFIGTSPSKTKLVGPTNPPLWESLILLAPKKSCFCFPSSSCGMVILTKAVNSVYSGVNLALLMPSRYCIPPMVFLIPRGSVESFVGSKKSVRRLMFLSISSQVAFALLKSSFVSAEIGKFSFIKVLVNSLSAADEREKRDKEGCFFCGIVINAALFIFCPAIVSLGLEKQVVLIINNTRKSRR